MKPNLKSGTLLGKDLMSCEMGKIRVVMNKPVYLSQAILDLSKIIMYEFHYDYMKRKYRDEDLKLCYMDTDSLIYSIRTEDFYKDIANDVEARFDTSGYIPDRPLLVVITKKRSHTQLDSRKQVIAFQDRVITINIKEAQHPLK